MLSDVGALQIERYKIERLKAPLYAGNGQPGNRASEAHVQHG